MTEIFRSGYAVQFLSRYTGFACFQAITGVRDRMLRSTVRGVEIAFWPTEAAAVAWLALVGLRPNDPVPVGIGHMTAGVRPFAADLVDPEWCRGALFEVPRGLIKPAMPEPVAVPVAPPEPEAAAPEPYRPSNGCEGEDFISGLCARCTKYRLFGGCRILAKVYLLDVEDKGYPSEWVRDPVLGPTCTAFVDKETAEPTPRRRHKPSREQLSLF